MAVNRSRSMNVELTEGAAEGSNRQLTPDRGGDVDMYEPLERARVLSTQYHTTVGVGKFERPDEPLLERLHISNSIPPHAVHRSVEKTPLR